MSDPYASGGVWWARIDFRDGQGERKKYLVLLSDCPETGDAVIAMTTSRGYRYHNQTASPCGCPEKSYYRIDAGQEPCFPETTYVQFTNTATLTRQDLAGFESRGTAEFLQTLDGERLRSILNCAKKSLDMTGRELQLVENQLKAFKLARKTPPKGQSVASPPPPSPLPPVGVAAVRRRYETICVQCRVEFVSLMGILEVDFMAVLAEKRPPPASFLESADTGFEMARELASTGCTCRLPGSAA